MIRSRRDGGMVLVVANSTDQDAGYVGDRFVERGHGLRTVLRDQDQIPSAVPDGVGHVLLLGSEWSVHAPTDPEALDRELALACSARAAGVPVLGLCYGAQVLARALGGSVRPSPVPEFGLVMVESTDPDLVAAGPWCAFHTDVMEPPPTAEVVARNGCGVQAFALPGILGVQFHPEVRPDVLAGWTGRFPALAAEVGAVAADVVDEMRRREARARALAYGLVDAFLDRADRR